MAYQDDALDADQSFREDGQLFTITRQQPGTYVDGKVVAAAPVTVGVWGIETDVSPKDIGFGAEAGTLVQAGDRKLYVSALADDGSALPTPTLTDILADANGQKYAMKRISPVRPGGVVIMWTLIVRS
jgi:hypothetical protein